MQDIPTILNRISNIGSTNEKKRIMSETKSNLLKYIFKQTYDPFINYGTVKIDTSDIKYNEDKIIDKKWFADLNDILYVLENRKLTGNLARNKIKDFISDSPEQWGNLVLKILKKDLRIGAGKSIINKVYNNLFPENICMSAMKYERKRISFPVYSDIKLDGVRCIANTTKDTINLFSRNSRLFKNYPIIVNEIKQLNLSSFKIDGEITMGHFQNLMRTISRKDEGIELAKDAIYNIFDIIIEDVVFVKRLEILHEIEKAIKEKNLKHLKVVKGRKIENEDELSNFYKEQLELGHEGIMIKPLNGLYEYKRSYSWQKMKPEKTEDLPIIRGERGTGKYENLLGAIVCRLPNGNEVHVGSGFTDDERKKYWNKKEDLPGIIAEVKYQEKTKDGSLRFPVFLRFRRDLQNIS